MQGQICDTLRPQLAMNRFLPLWPHRFSHFVYIHLGGGGVGGSDFRSMSSIRPICKCRCPPLLIIHFGGGGWVGTFGRWHNPTLTSENRVENKGKGNYSLASIRGRRNPESIGLMIYKPFLTLVWLIIRLLFMSCFVLV